MPALPFVRKIKSTLDAGHLISSSPRRNTHATQPSTNDEQAPSTPTRLEKSQHNRLHTRVSSLGSQSFSTLRSQPERTFVDLRRRLARKASVFSLRAKRWKAEVRGRERERGQEQGQENYPESGAKGTEQFVQQEKVLAREAKDCSDLEVRSDVYDKANEGDPAPPGKGLDTPSASSIATIPSPHIQSYSVPAKPTLSAVYPGRPLDQIDSVQAQILGQQENYVCREIAGGVICVNMSSEQAPPPVPYTRLKEITENACSTALSNVTAYSHTDTESWNTTIINSILGALVEDTSKSGSASSQPQFKYVVNSTIIQHASSSSESPKTAGRRGMHAASGAYWNNEKDGMWSYKYPGAESKGLDVVVGIIWIWVGTV